MVFVALGVFAVVVESRAGLALALAPLLLFPLDKIDLLLCQLPGAVAGATFDLAHVFFPLAVLVC